MKSPNSVWYLNESKQPEKNEPKNVHLLLFLLAIIFFKFLSLD